VQKIEDDRLKVPLLKNKKRAGSKAPAFVLGEQPSARSKFYPSYK
jgi:hypothetical protein